MLQVGVITSCWLISFLIALTQHVQADVIGSTRAVGRRPIARPSAEPLSLDTCRQIDWKSLPGSRCYRSHAKLGGDLQTPNELWYDRADVMICGCQNANSAAAENQPMSHRVISSITWSIFFLSIFTVIAVPRNCQFVEANYTFVPADHSLSQCSLI